MFHEAEMMMLPSSGAFGVWLVCVLLALGLALVKGGDA